MNHRLTLLLLAALLYLCWPATAQIPLPPPPTINLPPTLPTIQSMTPYVLPTAVQPLPTAAQPLPTAAPATAAAPGYPEETPTPTPTPTPMPTPSQPPTPTPTPAHSRITEAQWMLHYLTAPDLQPSGTLDTPTQAALARFQVQENLEGSGLLDDETMAKLRAGITTDLQRLAFDDLKSFQLAHRLQPDGVFGHQSCAALRAAMQAAAPTPAATPTLPPPPAPAAATPWGWIALAAAVAFAAGRMSRR